MIAFFVEILNGEGYIDVCGNRAVVQRQDLGVTVGA